MALSTIISSLLPDVVGIIDEFVESPEEREKAKRKLLEQQGQQKIREIEQRLSAIVMEAQSKDPWTSRARPSFMYVFYTMLLLCPVGAILSVWWPTEVFAAADAMRELLTAIPDILYQIFIAGYLGYTGFRSWDKRNLLKGKDVKGLPWRSDT